MSGFQLLMEPRDIVYQYDGSLAGFYSCVHTCVYARHMPLGIQQAGEAQCSMLPAQWVETDIPKATRVRDSIPRKISPRALELCEHVFLSCMEQKEMSILRFLVLGFREGARATEAWGEPCVAALHQAEKHLQNEAHLLAGFIRFTECDGKLIAAISPKNFVLSMLAPHFADRYAKETFLIYDSTHEVALVYDCGHAELVQLEGEFKLETSETEKGYQALWKRFYNTIAIEARKNHRGRMRNMSKRYWEHMIEVQAEL